MKRFGDNDAKVKVQAGASMSFSFAFTENNKALRQARSKWDYFIFLCLAGVFISR